jgi:hypothetical protein
VLFKQPSSGVLLLLSPPPLLLQLLPSDAVGRAATRLLIQRFSDKFVPAFYKLLVLQVCWGFGLCYVNCSL